MGDRQDFPRAGDDDILIVGTEEKDVQDAVTERKYAILVVGMHRSGTSAMARALSLAGAALPAHVMGASAGNPTGHWEPQRVADYNDRVFGELDTRWDDPFGPRRRPGKPLAIDRFIEPAAQIVRDDFGGAPLIVLKDPRVSRLIDLWEPACRRAGYDVRYVVMVRRPDAVAASLATRDGMNRNRGLLLWTSYMASTELATRDARRHFVRYEDLLDQPEAVLDMIEDRLDIVLPRRSWVSDESIRAFVKPAMNHEGRASPLRLGAALAPVGSLYAYLEALAAGIPGNGDVSDDVRTWLSALGETTAPILAESAARLADAEHDRVRRESETAERHRLELAERQAQLDHHVRLAEAGGAEADALRAELARVSEQAVALQADIARHVEAEGALRLELANHNQEGADTAALLTGLREQIAALEASREIDAGKLGAIRAERDVLLTRSSEVSAANDGMQAQIRDMEVHAAQLTQLAQARDAEREADAIRHRDAEAAWNAASAALHQELHAAHQGMAAETGQAEALRAQLAASQAAERQAAENHEAQVTRLGEMESAMRDLGDRHAGAMAERATMETELRHLRLQAAKVRTRFWRRLFR